MRSKCRLLEDSMFWHCTWHNTLHIRLDELNQFFSLVLDPLYLGWWGDNVRCDLSVDWTSLCHKGKRLRTSPSEDNRFHFLRNVTIAIPSHGILENLVTVSTTSQYWSCLLLPIYGGFPAGPASSNVRSYNAWLSIDDAFWASVALRSFPLRFAPADGRPSFLYTSSMWTVILFPNLTRPPNPSKFSGNFSKHSEKPLDLVRSMEMLMAVASCT